MEIIINEYRSYEHGEIMNLYKSVGWCSYTERPDMLRKAFERSLKILGAHDGEKLIGIIRTVGDGYSILNLQPTAPKRPLHSINPAVSSPVRKSDAKVL